ncbi:MAG: hypothetical protein WD065_19415, partial [Planctomycetaceae bacterium]
MSHRTFYLTLIIGGVFWVNPYPTSGENPRDSRTPQQAIEKGLEFLIADAVTWRKERDCATCHHGTLTVWALNEAKARGFPFDESALAENEKWTKERFLERMEIPRDTRPGWRMVSTPGIYLSFMALTLPEQKSLSPDELKIVTDHLIRHQEENGAWEWSSAPPKNRPPPFFESDEVATRLSYLALELDLPYSDEERARVNASREKAAAWLKTITPEKTTQSSALELVMLVQAREPDGVVQPQIEAFLARQNDDGGWGQLDDRASDAYATGQALYALNLAGVKRDRDEIQHAAAFLVQTQNDDGSWPMVRRGHPG